MARLDEAAAPCHSTAQPLHKPLVNIKWQQHHQSVARPHQLGPGSASSSFLQGICQIEFKSVKSPYMTVAALSLSVEAPSLSLCLPSPSANSLCCFFHALIPALLRISSFKLCVCVCVREEGRSWGDFDWVRFVLCVAYVFWFFKYYLPHVYLGFTPNSPPRALFHSFSFEFFNFLPTFAFITRLLRRRRRRLAKTDIVWYYFCCLQFYFWAS